MLTPHGTRKLVEEEFYRLAQINIDHPDFHSTSTQIYRHIKHNMAKKTIATLLNKTLDNLPRYSGKPDQDADEWLKELTATFGIADIMESQALKIKPTCLEGPAKLWFTENISVFENWTTFKAEFLTTYSSPTRKQLGSQRLLNRHQHLKEPIVEYYTDIIKLCKTINPSMTDISKLDHLYHGHKPDDYWTQMLKYKNLVLQQATSKTRFDKNRSHPTFIPGDLVWMKIFPNKTKLDARYTDPVQIIQFLSLVSFIVKDKHSQRFQGHSYNLKLVHVC